MEHSEISGTGIGTGKFVTALELLDTFHRAAEIADLHLYFSCFDRNGRFLGTDAAENWHVEEFYEFSRPYFQRGSGWTFRPKPGTRKLTYYPDESAPVFCVFDELLESESFVATSRGSGTLIFDQEAKTWLIAQYYLSFPIPNDLSKEMTRIIAVFEASAEKERQADEAARRLIEELELEVTSGNRTKGSSNLSTESKSSKGKGKKKR